jgi:hypothetical protein
MILSEIGYRRWSLENDVIFAQFQTSKETPGPVFGALNSTLNQFQWTSLVGYRVLEMKRSTFDLQAGFRMMSLGLDLELTPGYSRVPPAPSRAHGSIRSSDFAPAPTLQIGSSSSRAEISADLARIRNSPGRYLLVSARRSAAGERSL